MRVPREFLYAVCRMKSPGLARSVSIRVLIAATAVFFGAIPPSWAQAPQGANSGALTFTGGLDIPTLYVYRGIVQEGNPKVTLTPYGDLGVRLASGEGLFGSLRVNIGVWNSLNTGSSGTGGPLNRLHYAEQFYATATLGLGKGVTLTPGYLANTSPNGSYRTIHEMNLKLAASGRFAPYALMAFELSTAGQLDGGSRKGTYLEVGASPGIGLPLWNLRVQAPVKAGFSLRDYYQLFGSDLTYRDNKFGFVEVGGVMTVPLSVSPRFGSWNLHGGADVLELGKTTQAFDRGKKTKVIATVGIGMTY